MAQFDPYPGSDAEREALATLLARFAADRDQLMAGVQRTEAAVGQLGARVDALAGEFAELRRERASRDDGGTVAAVMSAVDDVRVELRRACLEMAEQAARHAERAAAGVAESSAEALAEALGQVRAELLSGLESTQRLAVASGERAALALAEVATLQQQRDREDDTVRAGLAMLREEILGRVGQAEARFGMRIDAIVAGIEAEARAVRDAFWDRVAGAEQRLQDAETVLAAVRAEMPRAAAEAFDGLASVQSGLDDLRDGLAATHARLAALETRGGGNGIIGSAVSCVRDEVVAVVMAVVSVGAVVGRLALSLLR